jgi:hypothetical protein
MSGDLVCAAAQRMRIDTSPQNGCCAITLVTAGELVEETSVTDEKLRMLESWIAQTNSFILTELPPRPTAGDLYG